MAKQSGIGNRRTILVVTFAIAIAAIFAIFASPLGRYARRAWQRMAGGGATVAQRLEQYGPTARERLKPFFDKAGVDYPPSELVLIGIKDRRQLELLAAGADGKFRHVRSYPIIAASGHLGPKLLEGDRQVPEGLYGIESLNPNSMFHLSLRVNYPNDDDRRRAAMDGRSNLGGDIMIHGSDASVGCLAMGDEAAEDLFVLAADVGLDNIELILTPVDFRTSSLPAEFDSTDAPPWTAELYDEIRERLGQLGGH